MSFKYQNSDKEVKQKLKKALVAALNQGLSIACYRLPYSSEIYLVAGEGSYFNLPDVKGQGYVISAFANENKVFFIEDQDLNLKDELSSEIPWHFLEFELQETERKDFIKKVRFGMEQIKGGAFDKVVLSRKKKLEKDIQSDPVGYFLNLEQSFPGGFISLVSTPKFGTWLGASPELLLKFKGKHIETSAVAGTIGESQSDFPEKDQQEQEIVSIFIEETFKKLKINYSRGNPEMVITGDIKHLKTDFTAELNGEAKPWQWIVNSLHPTPAVGGYPQLITKIFIRNEEGFDRKIYAGFQGPLLPDDEAILYVNIRCVELLNDMTVGYAGCGIVRGSQPEKEWEETDKKLGNIVKALNSHKP